MQDTGNKLWTEQNAHTHKIRLNSIKAHKHTLLFLCKQAILKEQE